METNGENGIEGIDWERVGRDLLAFQLRFHADEVNSALNVLADRVEDGERIDPSDAFEARERIDMAAYDVDKYLGPEGFDRPECEEIEQLLECEE